MTRSHSKRLRFPHCHSEGGQKGLYLPGKLWYHRIMTKNGFSAYAEPREAGIKRMREEMERRSRVRCPLLIEAVHAESAFGVLRENLDYKCAKVQMRQRACARKAVGNRRPCDRGVCSDAESPLDSVHLFQTIHISVGRFLTAEKVGHCSVAINIG